MKKNNGFGLLELLVAIGVMAVIAAIATPAVLTWRSNAKLRSAATQLIGAVQLAQSRAIREGKAISFDLETYSYTIYVDAGDGSGGPPNGKHDPQEPVVYRRQLPEGIKLDYNVTKTGAPAPPAAPEGSAAYNHLMDAAIAGGLFPVGFDFDKPSNQVAFYPRPGAENQWWVYLPNDGGVVLGTVAPGALPGQILFDSAGQCLNPQFIVMVNVNGKKMLIEVTRFGVAKVTNYDG